jgi:hypothetical protein
MNYALSGLVDWGIALEFIAGGALGGYFGMKVAVRLAERKRLLTYIFVGVVFTLAASSVFRLVGGYAPRNLRQMPSIRAMGAGPISRRRFPTIKRHPSKSLPQRLPQSQEQSSTDRSCISRPAQRPVSAPSSEARAGIVTRRRIIKVPRQNKLVG